LAQRPKIIPLAERRRLLLARSEQQRQQMSAELDNLRPTAAWVERGYSLVHTLRSVWPLVATAAGLLVATKGGSIFRSAGKIWSLWRIGRKFIGLWRRGSSASAPSEDRSPF